MWPLLAGVVVLLGLRNDLPIVDEIDSFLELGKIFTLLTPEELPVIIPEMFLDLVQLKLSVSLPLFRAMLASGQLVLHHPTRLRNCAHLYLIYFQFIF